MTRSTAALLAFASTLFAATAHAAAQCEGPTQDGNTWNLICSADNTDVDSDYQCDYQISVTTSQGTDGVEATGSVGQGQSGIIIWSAIQDNGADIQAAEATSGSCSSD